MTPPREPLASYRLQLGPDFDFARARQLVPYLRALGVSHLYLSPILEARTGSTHGYDVVDPLRVARVLGGEPELRALAAQARANGLELLLDIVPNHMAASLENRWWRSLLEHGPSSPFSSMFDIDWQAAGPAGTARVLLPVLPEPYGDVVIAGGLTLEARPDGPVVRCSAGAFPLDPGTWHRLLADLEPPPSSRGALAALTAASAALGPASRSAADRARPARARELRRRLRRLIEAPGVASALTRVCREVATAPLDVLLGEQPYRLAHWRLANEIAGYRRFFDVADLAAVRVDDPVVFRRLHRKVLQLLADGVASGLRIDHVDGLRHPRAYLHRLTACARTPAGTPWIVVEKILGDGERLPPDWPVAGTTGYEFLAAIADLFLDPEGVARLRRLHEEFAGALPDFEEVALGGKQRVADRLFAGEFARLHRQAAALALADPAARDLLPSLLRRALVGLSVQLPVYRTYVDDGAGATADEGELVHAAAAAATRREPELAPALAFLTRIITSPTPATLPFVLDWQQLTGPLMAKGVEDCALYRDFRSLSANDVGCHPAPAPGSSALAAFHVRARALADAPQRGLKATTTHDTKRGEDARCRLHVLSELVEEWRAALVGFRHHNVVHKRMVGGREVPDAGEEAFLYQTLVGAWLPGAAFADAVFVERIQDYVVKAAREARLHTSWRAPAREHETALRDFVAAALDPQRSGRFLADLLPLVERVAFLGAMNSLAMVAIKAATPGVPDFYRGTESWDLNLVDPDNRRPFAPERLASQLDELTAAEPGPAGLAELLRAWPDGRIKLFVTQRALGLRRRLPAVLVGGSYVPLATPGTDRVCAFARVAADDWVVCLAPVRVARLGGPAVGADVWGDAHAELPDGAPLRWRDEFTGSCISAEARGLALGTALSVLPVALLVGSSVA